MREHSLAHLLVGFVQDDTLRPRGSIHNRASQEQNPRMSMGPTSKRGSVKGSRRGSGSVTREDVSAAARRYGEPDDDDNKSQNSADSDTPLVRRHAVTVCSAYRVHCTAYWHL